MRINKRGISAIIATVLIILITVAAVTIIWVAIIPMIQNNLEVSDYKARVNVVSAGGYTVYDSTQNIFSVKVARSADEKDMVGMDIIILFADGSYSQEVIPPESNQEKVYVFNLSLTGHSTPLKVSVAPIFALGGTRQTAIASSSIKIPESPIINVPETLLELSTDSTADGGTPEPTCTDADNDGYNLSAAGCGPEDCNDANSSINPGATETCYDNIDNDCDGTIDNCIDLTGLVSWWSMEDVSGTTLADKNGAYPGEIIGATQVTGKSGLGQAMSFDGATTGVKIPNTDSPTLITGDKLSVSAWVNLDSYLIGDIISSSTFLGDGGFRLFVSNIGIPKFLVKNTTGFKICIATSPLTIGSWHNIVGVFDGATSIKVYIDGIESIDCPWAGATIRTATNNISIGANPAIAMRFTNSSIDEVMIFKRALTPLEVATLANA